MNSLSMQSERTPITSLTDLHGTGNRKPGNPKRGQNGLLQAVVITSCLLLGACVPSMQRDQQVLPAARLGASAQFDAWPAQDWWLAFQDPQLTRLITLALHDNPDIIQAAKRTEQASAYAGLARANTTPQLTGSASVSRQRLSENSFYPPPFAGSQQTLADAALNGSWDLDFWGKNRDALTAALSQVEAAKAEHQAAQLLVSVSVARTYYQLARLQQQKDIALQEVEQRQHILQLIQMRVSTGLDTDVELFQGKTSLPEAHAQLENIEESLALTQHALAALLAQPASTVQQLVPQVPAAAVQAVPDDVPADLLGRRPDLAAARARIEAAGALADSARAEYYPNISLTAFLGLSSFGLSNFVDIGSRVMGVGPALHLPIFDGGRLKANLKSKTVDIDLAVNSYNQVLIAAVHEVADQISSLQSLQKQTAEQKSALSAAESAYQVALVRYQGGLANYLSVLAAQDAVLRVRRNVVELNARSLDLDLALVRSLGGGFHQTTAMPRPASVSAG